MNQCKTKAVFGPIPSRRLGRSLGVDLLPFKTCSMDCVYCECGATTHKTLERAEYYPLDAVLRELDAVFRAGTEFDYMTFSGVGEPTLHSGLGAILRHVREVRPRTKICLLTNAASLGDARLQKELADLDLVIPSLDGSCEEEFQTINRPVPGLTLADVADGCAAFRKACPNVRMWLELFLVPGVNDSDESMERFRSLIRKISPDKVQLNSLDRPGAVDWIRVPERAELERIASALPRSGVPVEIVGRVKTEPGDPSPARITLAAGQYNDRILRALRSRPCTADDLAFMLNMNAEHILTHLRRMEKAGLLEAVPGPRGTFYRPI